MTDRMVDFIMYGTLLGISMCGMLTNADGQNLFSFGIGLSVVGLLAAIFPEKQA